MNKSSGNADELEMKRNEIETQRHPLQHYHNDTLSFMPAQSNEIQMRCLVDYSSYEQFLLVFVRDEEDRVVGLD